MKLSEVQGVKELLDSLPYYGLLIDKDHRLLMANDAAQKDIFTGDYPDVLKRCFEHIDKAGLPHPDCPLHEAVATGNEVHQTIKEPDGSWLRISIYPVDLTDDAGNRLYFHTIRDSTQMIREGLELGLRGELLDEVSDSIFVHNSEGKILYANRAAYEERGYTESEMLRLTVADMDAPEEVPKINRRMAKVTKDKSAVFETRHRRKDGSTFPVEVKARPIKYYDQDCFIATCRDITERNKEELEVKTRGDLLDSVNDSVFVIDRQGKIRFANRAAFESRGYSAEEILQMSAIDLTAPGTDGYAKQKMGEIFTKGQASFENWHKRKDGSIFAVEVRGKNVQLGNINGIIGVARDITERKKVEDEVRAERDANQMYLDLVNVLVIGFDPNGKVLMINRKGADILGYSEKEIAGKDWFAKFVPESTRSEMKDVFRRIVAGELAGVEDYENVVLTKSGRERLLVWHNTYVKDEKGQTTMVVSSAEDITDRRKSETLMRETERRLSTLIGNLSGIAYRCANDKGLTMEFVSDGCLDITGYKPADFVGNKTLAFKDIIHPEDRQRVRDSIKASLSRGTGYQLTYRIVARDGSLKWVSEQGRGVFNGGVKPIALEGYISDITATQAAQEEAARSYSRMQRVVDGTIVALAETVETKDPYTAEHQKRVAALASAIAIEMDLTQVNVDAIRMAATVHDIGKIYIPAEILNKPGKLTDLEFLMIKTHATTGYNILKDIDFDVPIAMDVLQHHERLDGSGYPNGENGSSISQNACIIAVADVVEAMSSHRPYRPGLGIGPALDEIKTNRGRLYDQNAVDACTNLFKSKRFSF